MRVFPDAELLSSISLRAVKSDTFLSIDSHVLQLLIPYKVQVGLSKFQRKFRRNQRIKLERKSTLDNWLRKSCSREDIQVPEFKEYERSTGILAILLGDHLEVFDSQVHYGIYFGIRNDVATVLDNTHEKNANGKSIQYRSLTDFLGYHQTFSIMNCQCPKTQDQCAFRLNVVRIAILLEECDYNHIQTYDLIKWNCDTYSWMCSTHR